MQLMPQISGPPRRRYMTMEKAYGELDKEDKGFLTYDELADKFVTLGATLSKGDLISLAADIDTDNDKQISKVRVVTSVPARTKLMNR